MNSQRRRIYDVPVEALYTYWAALGAGSLSLSLFTFSQDVLCDLRNQLPRVVVDRSHERTGMAQRIDGFSLEVGNLPTSVTNEKHARSEFVRLGGAFRPHIEVYEGPARGLDQGP